MPKPLFTSETGRLNGLKSVQAKRERKAKRLAALVNCSALTETNGQNLTKSQPDTIARELESRSVQLRAIVSRDLLDKAVILHEKNPVNGKDLSQHLASALTLVNAGDKLYGWSRSEPARCLVVVGEMEKFAPPWEKPEPETEPTPQPGGKLIA